MHVFSWVSYSVRPLTLIELQHALAARNPGLSTINEDLLCHKTLITKPCLGLIIINGSGIVGFMHSTAQEMFPEYLQEILGAAQSMPYISES